MADYDPKIDEVTREALLRFTPDQHRLLEQLMAPLGLTKYEIIRYLVAKADPRRPEETRRHHDG